MSMRMKDLTLANVALNKLYAMLADEQKGDADGMDTPWSVDRGG
jgi:hypothetical protein